MSEFQTYVEINLKNLVDNYLHIKGKVNVEVIPIVKADAYGHGSNPCVKALKEAGAKIFGVSSFYEASCIREEDKDIDILILGYIPDEKIEKVIKDKITPTVYNLNFAKALNEKAKALNKTVKIHIKVNTGMNRLGFQVMDNIGDVNIIKEISSLSNLEIQGLYTHFATSDEEDKTYAIAQYDKFKRLLENIKKEGISIPIIHMANSAAITDIDTSYFNGVRAGLLLYGIYPSSVFSKQESLYKPVMSFYSTISNIFTLEKGESISYGRTYTAKEEEKVGVVCVGYADGYNRGLSNKSEVLVGGKYLCPVIGNICMDMMMISLKNTKKVKVGDRVLLFGDKISVRDLAKMVGTIPYELLCLVNKRVKRVYKNQ